MSGIGMLLVQRTLLPFKKCTSSLLATPVDEYLWKIVSTVHGVEIHRPEYLKIAQPQVVVVLARSSAARSRRRHAVSVAGTSSNSVICPWPSNVPLIWLRLSSVHYLPVHGAYPSKSPTLYKPVLPSKIGP